MKYVPVVVACALAASLAAAPAASAADETKTARGTVSAVAGETVTIKAMDKDMVFKVTSATDVIARGGSTATREAKRMGAPGVKLGDLVKPGDSVEIHYTEAGGVMTAKEIRAGVAGGATGAPAAEEASSTSATGKVKALTGNSLTVTSAGKDWAFMIDAKTRIEEVGGSTKMREMAKLGKTPTLADFVGVNDEVRVTYHEMGGKLHATEVRVLAKAK